MLPQHGNTTHLKQRVEAGMNGWTSIDTQHVFILLCIFANCLLADTFSSFSNERKDNRKTIIEQSDVVNLKLTAQSKLVHPHKVK